MYLPCPIRIWHVLVSITQSDTHTRFGVSVLHSYPSFPISLRVERIEGVSRHVILLSDELRSCFSGEFRTNMTTPLGDIMVE